MLDALKEREAYLVKREAYNNNIPLTHPSPPLGERVFL